MDIKHRVLVKISNKSTDFIVIYNDDIVFLWLSVDGGGHLIINDVSRCFRIKFEDAKQRVKNGGCCLIETPEIKEEKLLAEVIGDRVEQIFKHIKEVLIEKALLQWVTCFYIIINENYIPEMDKLLSRVMELPATSINHTEMRINIETHG